MAADVTDKLDQVTSSATGRPVVTALGGSGHSIGGTSVTINAATNWSTTTGIHFSIYETTTVGGKTVKDATTQTDWKGTLASTTISNMTITGGTDRDYSAGAVIEITPTARYAKDLYDWGIAQHNQDGTHAAVTATSVNSAGAVLTDTVSEHTAAAGVTVDGVLIKDGLVQHTGAVQQMVYTSSSAVATGTTLMALDDTIPQNTEGDEYMTLAITPKATTNILVIRAKVDFSNSAAAYNMIGGLFQDSTANAVAAATVKGLANDSMQLVLEHQMVAGTTSATTFKLRMGGQTAGTTTINGRAAGRLFGAIPKSSMTITEYKA